MTSPSPANLVSVGIGLESSFGAGAAPTMLLPVTPPQGSTLVGQQVDRSWRSSAVDSYSRVIGSLAGAVQLGGLVLPDGIGFPLAGILPDLSFTAGSPNTWTMAPRNGSTQQPASYAVTINDPIGPLQYPGCVFSQLVLDFAAAALLTWSAKLSGLAPTTGAVTMPSPSTELPIAGWRGSVSVGGGMQANVMESTVTIDRPVISHTNVSGVLAPYMQRQDVVKVSGSLNFVALSDSIRAGWVAGTATVLIINYQYNAGAAARRLQLRCSDAQWTQVDRVYSGKWVEIQAAFEADANTTDVGATGGQSPIKATLRNTIGTGVYQ